MSIIAVTSVTRGSQAGESHGAVHLVDLAGGRAARMLDWSRRDIDWGGEIGGRGLAGIACPGEDVWVTGANELFRFSTGFELLGEHRSPYLSGSRGVCGFDGRLYVVSSGYDAILRFNPGLGRFDWGLQLADDDAGLRGVPFDPSGATGPAQATAMALDSVFADARGLFIAGGYSQGLLHFDGRRIKRLASLPEHARDARPWGRGVLFNDIEAGVSRFLTPARNRVFMAPGLVASPAGDAVEGPGARRPGGLAVLGRRRFVTGASPLSVCVHDIESMKTTRQIVLSDDPRDEVTAICPWPFPAP